MRLFQYRDEQGLAAAIALAPNGAAYDVRSVARAIGETDQIWTTRSLLEAGETFIERLAEAVRQELVPALGSPDRLELAAPLHDPDKIICLGLNYYAHANEVGMIAPAAPMLFAKFRNSLAGPYDPVLIPRVTQEVDYEAELAVVIGRRGKEIDGFAPCGPALVLRDELPDLQSLSISTRVNGLTVQAATTDLMIHPIDTTIAFISSLMTLEVGDVIATGTPAGVGMSREPKLTLTGGDEVEVEVEGIGTLRNRFVSPATVSA